MIHDDTPCSRCGYSLRTLRRDGNCPECGTPVATSLLGPDDRALLAREEELIASADQMRCRRVTIAVIGVIVGVGVTILAINLGYKSVLHMEAVVVVIMAGWLGAGAWLHFARMARARLRHVEYVLHCRAFGDASRDPKSRRRDDRMVKGLNRYPRDVRASSVLLALSIAQIVGFGYLAFVVGGIGSDGPPLIVLLFVAITGAWICWMAININRVWRDHARSIEYYRRARSTDDSATAND